MFHIVGELSERYHVLLSENKFSRLSYMRVVRVTNGVVKKDSRGSIILMDESFFSMCAYVSTE